GREIAWLVLTASGWWTSTTRPGKGPGMPNSGRRTSVVRPWKPLRKKRDCRASQDRGAPTARPAPAPRRKPRRVRPQQPGMPPAGEVMGGFLADAEQAWHCDGKREGR